MSEYEMNGLRVIVDEAVERGTLHVLAPEPRRADYTTDGDYRRAYREWWRKMNCWTITNVGESETSGDTHV